MYSLPREPSYLTPFGSFLSVVITLKPKKEKHAFQKLHPRSERFDLEKVQFEK